MASTSNLRLVKCPKCRNTLKKPADLAVYQCGACNTILKSTRWMAGGNNSAAASTDSTSISSQKNASQMTKSNHETKSSSDDTCLTNEEDTFNSEDGCCGTREENLKRSAGSGNETGREEEEEEEEEDIKTLVGDKTKTILDPRKNNSDNEKKPTNKASTKDFVDYIDGSAFPSHGASSSYHSPTTNLSSPAYEGSISSSSSPDDKKGGGGGGERTRNQHRLLVSRRTFRPSMQKTDNKVGGGDIMSDEKLQFQVQVQVCSPAQTQTSSSSSSSSKCNSSEVIQSHRPRKEDPPHQHQNQNQLHPSSDEFHSTCNSVDSEEGKSFGYHPKKDYWRTSRNQSPSSKFRDIENSRMELLRKVESLRYKLAGSSSRDLSRPPRPPLYGNQQFPASSLARPRSYPSSQLVSSDQTSTHCCSLHCAIICGNNGLCASCSHSKTPTPLMTKKNIICRAKDKVVKRHCRPILGGANFIICDHCYCVLQIPEDVHFSTTTTSTHKIQCGNCRNILTLSIRETNHNISPPFSYESVDTYQYQDRGGTAGVPNSYCSEEYEAEPSSNGDEHEGPPSPLHRLMGYYSASDVIYQPPE